MSAISGLTTPFTRLCFPRERLFYNLSLYLVANRPSFQDESLFFLKIQEAVRGGVSCVQLRDHKSDYPTCLTRILSGGYLHTIYKMDLLDTGKYDLVPIMVRHEGVGSCYALHHSQYHSIIEEPNTVSLIVRGPIEKESFQVIAEKEGEVRPKDSLTLQTMEEKKQKAMTLADYEKVLSHLLFLKIIDKS